MENAGKEKDCSTNLSDSLIVKRLVYFLLWTGLTGTIYLLLVAADQNIPLGWEHITEENQQRIFWDKIGDLTYAFNFGVPFAAILGMFATKKIVQFIPIIIFWAVCFVICLFLGMDCFEGCLDKAPTAKYFRGLALMTINGIVSYLIVMLLSELFGKVSWSGKK